MTDSSSSFILSSSSHGLSFLLEESSDDSPILKNIINNENGRKLSELALKIRQIRQQSRAPLSSRRPRKKKGFVKIYRQEPHDRIYEDYFAEDSICNEAHFRHRFHMREHLFLRIVDALVSCFEYFQLRYGGLSRRGLSPLTTFTAAMQTLAYDISKNYVDKYLQIGESTTTDCMKNFAARVIQVFREGYLRKPIQADVDLFVQVSEARDLLGSLNDLNVLPLSDVFQEVYEGRLQNANMSSTIVNTILGIFCLTVFIRVGPHIVTTIPFPQGAKAKLFVEHQESTRTDVERTFWVLQARFTIIRGPTQNMINTELGIIMKTCVMLHNMIIEDEHDSYDLTFEYDDVKDNILQPNV